MEASVLSGSGVLCRDVIEVSPTFSWLSTRLSNRKRPAERPAVFVAMKWLGILDSNQDYLIQSQAAYR